MEFSVKEWLILIGVLLIVVVLLDAVRRFRHERRHGVRLAKMSFGAGGGHEDAGPDVFVAELPNGGARVIRRGDAPEAPSKKPAAAEEVPRAAAPAGRVEPRIGDIDPDVAEAAQPSAAEPPPAVAGNEAIAGEDEVEASPVEEVVVVNVIAEDGASFNGTELLQILLACDVRFGKMQIFHRYEQGHGKGRVQFSVANAVEPGTFDLDNIEGFATPGICMFLQLPGPHDPEAALDCMIETARCIVNNLGGRVLDVRRQDLTPQVITECRKRVQAFAQRRLSEADS